MTSRVFTVAALMAVALAGALNMRAIIAPLQDFNEWIYQGWLVGEILHGAVEHGAFGLAGQ